MSDQIERLTDEEIRNLKIEVGCLYNPDPDPGEGDYWYVRLGWQMFERYEDGKAWAEALKRRVMAFLDEMQEARERLEEREADMHVRIRQEYDSTVADAWRAEVARKDERIEELEEELADEKILAGKAQADVDRLRAKIAEMEAEGKRQRDLYEEAYAATGIGAARASKNQIARALAGYQHDLEKAEKRIAELEAERDEYRAMRDNAAANSAALDSQRRERIAELERDLGLEIGQRKECYRLYNAREAQLVEMRERVQSWDSSDDLDCCASAVRGVIRWVSGMLAEMDEHSITLLEKDNDA